MKSPHRRSLSRAFLTASVCGSVFGFAGAAFAQQPAAKPAATGPTNEILDAPNDNAPRRRPDYTFAPGVTIPDGPTKLDWNSVKANYRVPQWLEEGKFGIFIHWGLYSVAAHHNEWYGKHMYQNGGIIKWHAEKFGPQDKFGYKDFIPLFKAEKFDPDEWATLFKESGAKWVIPTAEHHDHFAMWDSKLTRWDAMELGPHRDLIGDLAKSVRAQGLKYGVSNHRMFGYDFMDPDPKLKTDLYDPAYADFYGPPAKKGTLADQAYCNDWLARNIELIDKYQPDFMWFDWDGTGGTNPVKLQFAAYYFNRAAQWGKEVAISQKGDTFPVDTGVPSHEKGGRAPKDIMPKMFMVDDVISDRSWGYTDDMKYRSATSIVQEIVEQTSKGGSLMLNISPRGDGSIPQEQQDILRSIGKWFSVNGEAIYGTRPWKQFGDGKTRFTTKGDTLYAILNGWPRDRAVTIPALGLDKGTGTITDVSLLGHDGKLAFTQDASGLNVTLPAEALGEHAFVLKIAGASTK